MNIKTIGKQIGVGIALISNVACEPPVRNIPLKSGPIVEMVDSFANSTFNKADTVGLSLFKIDTLKISEELFENHLEISKGLKQIAKFKIPEVVTGKEYKYGYHVVNYNGKSGMGIKLVDKKEPLLIPKTTETVMQNKVLTNEKGNKFYVPVNYYAEKDPKFKPEEFNKRGIK